jgi:hypothetical protein
MISSYDQWLSEYRKDKYRIWIKILLSNNEERYFCNYKDWYDLKDYCKSNKIDVKEVGLQYRSNYLGVDTTNCDGVYLVQSMIGLMGETSRKTYTVGKIYGNIVKKQIFMTPELIQDREDEDSVESCFEEGLLYHYGKAKAGII